MLSHVGSWGLATVTASSGQHVNGFLIVSCCRGGGHYLINAPSR